MGPGKDMSTISKYLQPATITSLMREHIMVGEAVRRVFKF
jgi:hypothetical protein